MNMELDYIPKQGRFLKLRCLFFLCSVTMLLDGVFNFFIAGLMATDNLYRYPLYKYHNRTICWVLMVVQSVMTVALACVGIGVSRKSYPKVYLPLAVLCLVTIGLKFLAVFVTVGHLTDKRIKENIKDIFLHEKGLMSMMHFDQECCGMNGSGDYIYIENSTDITKRTLPLTCCKETRTSMTKFDIDGKLLNPCTPKEANGGCTPYSLKHMPKFRNDLYSTLVGVVTEISVVVVALMLYLRYKTANYFSSSSSGSSSTSR